jgi:Flp pilus assembly protein TadD/TolB-like protein
MSAMKSQDEINDSPSGEAVRVALERILSSTEFTPAPKLGSFLRFVVEATLTGRADRIKSYTIGVEALGRKESFDPHTDPIVRVEAGRLRKALARYYAGVGADCAILIDLPVGSYVPSFGRRKIERDSVEPGAIAHLARGLTAVTAVACTVGLVVAGIFIAVIAGFSRSSVLPPATEGMRTAAADTATTGVVTTGSGMPIVVVAPLQTSGAAASEPTPDGFQRKLRAALARFDEIQVSSEPAPRPGTAYRISATLEYQPSDASLSLQLHDGSDGRVAWSKDFEQLAIAGDRLAVENGIVRKVATTLAQPYGVIYALELAKVSNNDRGLRYHCLLQAMEYRRSDDFAAPGRVRACLEHAIALHPTFAGGLAALSRLQLQDYYAGNNLDQAPLDQALKTALRAVELAPESARAHQALMNALFSRGEVSAALAEGERAVALNPNDMTVLVGYGIRVAGSGDLERGRALLYEAAAQSPVRPPVLNFALFLCAHLLGDDKTASYNASLLTSETDRLALLAQALDALRSGDRARAERKISKLVTLYPSWRSDPRRLERILPSAALRQRLAQDLAALGLPGSY